MTIFDRVPRKLHLIVSAVAPIHGISFRDTVIIQFKEEATAEQRAAAQAILDAFDPVQAQAEIEAEEQAELDIQAWLKTARTAFLTLKARYDKLETWAKTKGYTS